MLADNQMSNYFLFGNIIMILLSVFNLVFLIEFFCQQIPKVTKVFKTYVLKRKSSSDNEVDAKILKDIKVK